MKLGDKILELRKKKGLSQEELGELIDVTRQTISNWELGETSPNPDQLKLLSKELNVSIDELLDNDIKSVIEEKVSNTEKLSTTILYLLKFFLLMFIIGVIIVGLFLVFNSFGTKDRGRELEKTIYCNIYGEQHSLTAGYYEYTGTPTGIGGDSYFIDILDLNKYDDVNQMFNIINDYVKRNGGACKVVEDSDFTELVDISIKEGTLTNEGLTLLIKAKEDNDFMLGESFWLERYNRRTSSFEIIEENHERPCTFNAIGYTLSKDKTLEINQNWGGCIGKLDKGTYRLVKYLSFEHDKIRFKDFYIWIEFEIN